MTKWINRIEEWLLSLNLQNRLRILYIVCIIIPLFLTDSIILYSFIKQEAIENQHEMENVASSVSYSLSRRFESAVSTANTIFLDNNIEEFLNKKYATNYDYIDAYQAVLKNSYLEHGIGFEISNITIYAENNTILNGGRFGQIDKIKNTDWYLQFEESGQDVLPIFYLDDSAEKDSRKILIVRNMSEESPKHCRKIIKIEIDYPRMVRDITNNKYDAPFYVCHNGKIIFSNQGANKEGLPYEEFEYSKKVSHSKTVNLYGEDIQIYILGKTNGILKALSENSLLVILLLLLNIGIPYLMMRQIEKSITRRIFRLGKVFEDVDSGELKKIENIEGNDEITVLMQRYNQMAERINDLIETVYKNKVREQEIDIARQNAELLALHSQINPHFLFNTLETIRMHSVLKQEIETADMVAKLAVMQRQYVNWGDDLIELRKEIEFIKAYLELQKYRFGDRLNYSLEVEPMCEDKIVPKLTLVTFVENACVHGLENKAAKGWIFVRAYEEKNFLCIEVEDTGTGMQEAKVAELLTAMKEADIESLKGKESVGIKNACLRLRMYMEHKVHFSIESELGVGTIIQIKIEQCEIETE